MKAPRFALAALAAVALAGCGQAASQRPQLAAYLKHVQTIEGQMQKPLSSIRLAAGALAGDQKAGNSSLGKLAVSSNEGTLRGSIARQGRLRAELAALRTPRQAARLRGLLLRLADRQLALTHELARFVVFLPRFNGLVQSLGPATQALQRSLSAGGTYSAATVGTVFAQKAAALRSFKTTVDRVAVRVSRLKPPKVSRPGWRTQLQSLHGMSASAGRLAGALTGGSTAGVPALLLAFDRAASLNRTIGAQKAQIAAVRAYNREVKGLERLVVAIERERYRLDRAVH